MLSRETLKAGPSSRNLLTRVLAMPDLPAQIRALPGSVLGKLLEHVGLEDSAELVALAQPEQLLEILDVDLWRSPRPGRDERFDSARFLLWLHVLLDVGEGFAAERLAELSPDLLTLALHRHVLVLSQQALLEELADGDDEADATEKALDGCLSEELDEFLLVWRGGDGWDDLLGALLALDRDHHGFVVDILERCAHLSSEHITDNGGLYEVLSSEDMLEGDLGAERETRRAEQGYVAPSAAAAFLRLALRERSTAPAERDPLTRAYFRDVPRQPRAVTSAASGPAPGRDLSRMLASAGLLEGAPHKQLPGSRDDSERPLLTAALQRLATTAPAALAQRYEELAYLSNVLTAGCSVDGRRLRPVDAIQLGIDCVSLGLWLRAGGAPADAAAQAASVLEHETCDRLFRAAFAAALEPGLRLKPKNAASSLRRVRALLKSMKV